MSYGKVNKSTGERIPYTGGIDVDKVGNLNILTTTNKTDAVSAINEVNENKCNKIDLADDFSTSVSYSKGDYVFHLGTLYECTTAHTAGAWNAAHFTATQVCDELNELKNTLSDGEIVTITSISGAPEGVSLCQDSSNYKKHGQVACFLLHINVPAITVGSTISFTLGQYPSNAMDYISISGFCASTAFLGIISKGGSVTIRVLGANLTSSNTVRFYALIPLQG